MIPKKEMVLSLNLGGNRLKLWRKNQSEGTHVSLPSEDKYRIEYHADHHGKYDNIQLSEALIMVINILAGIAESETSESGEYRFTREQILAMSSVYSQLDSPYLVELVSTMHEREYLAIKGIRRI